MKLLLLISGGVCLVATTASGQLFDSRYTTIEGLDGLAADLAERTTAIPKNSFQVYSEREWANEQLASVRVNQANFSDDSSDESANIAQELDAIWNVFRGKLAGLDANNLKDFVASDLQPFWSDFYRRLFAKDYELLDIYDELEQIVKQEPLNSVLETSATEEGEPAEFDNAGAIINALQGSFAEAIGAFIPEIRKYEKDEAAKKKLISDRLKRVHAALVSYRKDLTEQLKQSVTKNSLTANLYLMITIIGGLSILAIAIVRWFPEPVMLEWVESGQVIQFVTVMILLSAIMALGLAGLLTENTLGALLGGIGGYVLSQGVGRTAARNAIRDIGKANVRGGKDGDVLP